MLIVLVLGVAAGAGYLGRRYVLRAGQHDEALDRAEALPLSELIVPIRTMSALLVGFVLFAVYNSFAAAGHQAAVEAGAVLSMAEEAVLLQPDARRDVLGQVQCYARSVAGPEWDAQAARQSSPITDGAADGITRALARASTDPRNSPTVSQLIGDNRDRIQARIQRLDEGKPSVPTPLWALLLVTVAVTLTGTTLFAHPAARKRVQVAVLVGTTVVFGFTLLVINDLDRPYAGPSQIRPTAMQNVLRRMAALPDGDQDPPCDAQGRSR